MITPLTCMISALWFEGRQFYQQPESIKAIATVILNRVDDKRYPDTICGVVNQHKQFSFTHDGKSDTPTVTDEIQRRAMVVVLDVANDAIMWKPLDIPSTHYHTTEVSPYWADTLRRDGVFGTHVFYTWE